MDASCRFAAHDLTGASRRFPLYYRAGGPLPRPLRDSGGRTALTPEEVERFPAHLRPRSEHIEKIERSAFVYLTAVKHPA